jgi:predicted amidohydrolase
MKWMKNVDRTWLSFGLLAMAAAWIGAAGVWLGAAGTLQAAEPNAVEHAKARDPSGARWVGIASICQPQFTSKDAMSRLIDTAALNKPDIIVLTEGCMQNSSSSTSPRDQEAKAELLSPPGPISAFLAQKAKQHHTYIIASFWRKNPKVAGRYNSAVLFDRQGKIVGCYDKMFPTIGEMEEGILPGRGAVVFDTDFGRIGALICFDLNFNEVLAEYKSKGAELLCFLSAYRGGARVPAIAMQNQCYIASAVPGENGVIVDPLGRTLAESSQYGRIIFAKINLDCRVVHIDYNEDRVRLLKEKYGPAVKIEVASPEAYYFISSLHPEKSVRDMIKEFQIETLDHYLDRARSVRHKYLPKTE